MGDTNHAVRLDVSPRVAQPRRLMQRSCVDRVPPQLPMIDVDDGTSDASSFYFFGRCVETRACLTILTTNSTLCLTYSLPSIPIDTSPFAVKDQDPLNARPTLSFLSGTDWRTDRGSIKLAVPALALAAHPGNRMVVPQAKITTLPGCCDPATGSFRVHFAQVLTLDGSPEALSSSRKQPLSVSDPRWPAP